MDRLKKRLVFLALFTAAVFLASYINFSAVLGMEGQHFTLLQFFGPIAGGFLGPILGGLSVLGAELISFFISGSYDLVTTLRLLPMVFAAYYFGMKRKSFPAFISLGAIALFLLHPVGRQAWLFSVYWTIPLIVALIPEKYNNLFLKSLGATFTAHAVGGIVWIYTVPMTLSLYMTLIPIVAVERLLFASGISVSYLTVDAVLDRLPEKWTDSLKLGKPVSFQ